MARLRSDSGFALLEAVVSAAVLAIIALAILAGIDGASASSGREKARNVAASLAEADQERLRAIPVADLAKVATTAPYVVADPTGSTKTVDGTAYTVVSKAQYVADDSGDGASCTTDTKTTQYFHISSTVTSALVGTGKPVPPMTIDSVLAPNVAYSSAKGTLVVHVADAKGSPLANKLVRISGGLTAPPSQATNALGCAVFEQLGALTGGTPYTASLNDGASVDHSGNTAASTVATVMPGKVNSVTMYYDRPATVTANVSTYTPGANPSAPTAVKSAAYQVSATNSGDTGMLRTWPVTVGAELASVAADKVFPFTTAYTYFTGNCHYNDPTTTAYNNTGTAITALLAGQQQPATQSPVSVYQPPLNAAITASASGGTPKASMTVDVKPVAPPGDSCSQPAMTFSLFKVTGKWMVGRSYTAGALDAGVPYGRYKLCFHDTVGTTTYSWAPATYPNAGTAAGATYYDNTTPPTGQGAIESFTATTWTQGTTCP